MRLGRNKPAHLLLQLAPALQHLSGQAVSLQKLAEGSSRLLHEPVEPPHCAQSSTTFWQLPAGGLGGLGGGFGAGEGCLTGVEGGCGGDGGGWHCQ